MRPAPPLSASRRAFLAAAGLFAAVGPPTPAPAATTPSGWLPLESAGVGRGALRAIEETFSTDFAAYLSRFLITWEPETGKWWRQQKVVADSFEMADTAGLIGIVGEERRNFFLAAQFSSLVTSVEVGLEAFEDEKKKINATRLAQALSRRYTTLPQKRALAQLLCLLAPPYQPTSLIAAIIGEADNARVAGLALDDPGRGYGPNAPAVDFGRPPASSGRVAKGRAAMRPTGRWRGKC